MAATAPRAKLVVIVGPTASGKSGLAMRVAKAFNGEIICADSRTIYKGMNIGTAKPSKADQKAVPHWGLDLVEPGQRYSAAQFKAYAQAKILDIQKRGKLPILVGGTGLYIDSVLFDFSFIEPKKLALKQRLVMPWWSIEKLQKMIQQRDWPMPENSQNRRHLINTIQRQGQVGDRTKKPRSDAVIIGLLSLDVELKKRIAARAEAMFSNGIIEETRQLSQSYGRKAFSGTAGIVYKIVVRLIKGEIEQEQAIELFNTADWQYARRQKTWFKRNTHINWFNDPKTAEAWVSKQLRNA